jgi:dienelactone hydrolase
MTVNRDIIIAPSELTLRFTHPVPRPRLAFRGTREPFEVWRELCRLKLAELLHVSEPAPCRVIRLRETVHEEIRITALRMDVDANLSIPAYLLQPCAALPVRSAVLALHGHGEAESCIGLYDDYHHSFAFELAKRGHCVLCPELRGFGALSDLARDLEGYRLNYWEFGGPMAYSLVTDGFLHGHTLLGETVEDLLRWETWLEDDLGIGQVQVAGISYGGDLACIYPVFSQKVTRILASGTLGSFSIIFSRCYNAPAHCVPHVLNWLDRADIAGLNAPRPLMLHYGELDTPGEGNYSASFNDSVPDAVAEVRRIYGAVSAATNVQLVVSLRLGHEMDLDVLERFLAPALAQG